MQSYKYYAIHIIDRNLDVIVDNWKDAMSYTKNRLYMLKGFNNIEDASFWLMEIAKEDENKVKEKYYGKDLVIKKTTSIYNDGRIEIDKKEIWK